MKFNIALFLSSSFIGGGCVVAQSPSYQPSSFVLLGNGLCLDDDGYKYAYVQSGQLSYEILDEQCFDWCLSVDDPDIVGVGIYRHQSQSTGYYTLCLCYFSGGYETWNSRFSNSDFASLYEPDAEYWIAWPGMGVVTQTSGEDDSWSKCYRNDDCSDIHASNTPSFSPSVTSSPSFMTEFCVKFNDPADLEGFAPCPGASNIEVKSSTSNTWADDPINPLSNDYYLHLRDQSDASLACGTNPSYTGDWTAWTGDLASEQQPTVCHELCFDVALLYDPTTGGTEPQMKLQGGAPDYYRATFKAYNVMTDSNGSSPGWRRICAPIRGLDSDGSLPSNDDGYWIMGVPHNYLSEDSTFPSASPSPNTAWLPLLSNIAAIILRIDFTTYSERFGFDNICLEQSVCQSSSLSDLPSEQPSAVPSTSTIVSDMPSERPSVTSSPSFMTEFCVKFNDPADLEGFAPCPGASNIEVKSSTSNTWADDPINPLSNDYYLHLRDQSDASLACGTNPSYTGDWTAWTGDLASEQQPTVCHQLCFDIALLYDPTTGGTEPHIMLQGGAPDYYRATFKAYNVMTDSNGSSPGWRRICAPIRGLDSDGSLPSNDDGYWIMGVPHNYLSEDSTFPSASPSPNTAWLPLLSNIAAIILRIDFTTYSERFGFDNICLEQSVCPSSSLSDLPSEQPSAVPSTSTIVSDMPSERLSSLSTSPIPTFSYVGIGSCVDSSGLYYSYAQSFTLPADTTNSYCFEWCSQNQRDLVGVEIHRDPGTSYTTCYCRFSGGLPDGLTGQYPWNSYSPDAVAVYQRPVLIGTGAVDSSDGHDWGGFECYRNDDYSDASPSVSPAPSASDSGLPEPHFTQVCCGSCLDAEGNGYSYVQSEQFSWQITREQCFAWCSSVDDPDFVGVGIQRQGPTSLEWEFFNTGYTLCQCYFSGGYETWNSRFSNSDFASLFEPVDAEYWIAQPGMGVVTQAFGENLETECYKNEHYGCSFSKAVKTVRLSSITGSFKIYEVMVYVKGMFEDNLALGQSVSFTSGTEDSSNPASNAVDMDTDTFTQTTSGDGTLEVTLSSDFYYGSIYLEHAYLGNGILEFLDESGTILHSRTINNQISGSIHFDIHCHDLDGNADTGSDTPSNMPTLPMPTTPFCVKFNDPADPEGFAPCPGASNIEVKSSTSNTLGDDPINSLSDDYYLHLRYQSYASIACACGTDLSYTGDWTAWTGDLASEQQPTVCHELCFDVALLYDPTTGGGTKPEIQLQGGAPDYYRATFKAYNVMTDSNGSSPGWRRICAPIRGLDSNGSLPSNNDGYWYMDVPYNYLSEDSTFPSASPSPNTAWLPMLSNIAAIILRIDFSTGSERFGFDNICLEQSVCPSSRLSDLPSEQPSAVPSTSTIISDMKPSSQPSSQPSSMPSTTLSPSFPTEASEAPSVSSSPSSTPSASPSNSPTLSMEPTSLPSAFPPSEPSNVPSSTPSNSPTIHPTKSPTMSPTSMPSLMPSTVEETVTIFGSLSSNQNICKLSGTQLAGFVEATVRTIRKFACPDPTDTECFAKIISACARSRRELRQLQSSPWQIEYAVTQVFNCQVATCDSPADIASVSSISGAVASSMANSISSGSFLAVLSTNILLTPGLDASLATCMSVWGMTEEPVTAVSAQLGTGRFYPDWNYGSGTCLEDGNEPIFMMNNPSWILGSLEECCTRYYSWNTNKCMNSNGSGLWYADQLNEVCVIDCDESSGSICGGIADLSPDKLFADPKSCCESQLSWRLTEFCEAESLQTGCYGGTGLYYRGDSTTASPHVDICVKDCDPASGDQTCGGLVKESWVTLYETAEDCCAYEYSSIDNELCAARSTISALRRYWPDKTTAKCHDDSVVPTEDLTIAIYGSIEDCCLYGLSWLSKGECLAASGMELTGLGSNKFYVDWVNDICVKDCIGSAPCGGLKQEWEWLYDTKEECCKKIWWVSACNED